MLLRAIYRLVLCAAMTIVATGSVHATLLAFTAVDLADKTPGQDRWQYRYSVNGTFVQFGGFNVLFAPSLYKLLEDPPPTVNSDWQPTVTQPDPLLGADGLYTATALRSNPSLSDEFVVNFVWLGRGTPAPQPFEIFDDTFQIIETGSTIARVVNAAPTTGTLSLQLIALLLLAVARRRAAA